MQITPRDASDPRVRLRYHVDLHYEATGSADFLLNIHAAHTSRQTVVSESLRFAPDLPVRMDADPSSGNRIVAFRMEAGTVDIHYEAVVEISHAFAEPPDVVANRPADLPAATLRYLYPSRYCQADLIQQRAWDLFGRMRRDYAQVRAVADWVRQQLRFQTGTSGRHTSVVDTLRDGVGVCRDFAHTMIAFCRALNYPARFVTGVDYGADPALGPPDFHAYVEVFLGSAWYLFDPTGISPVTGLLRIGTGRDAADVSIATIFGPVKTGMPTVAFDAIENPLAGLALPRDTLLAVSTAE